MSDAEKIISYYENTLKKERPVVVRWEGAGDCRHPYRVLQSLLDAKVNFRAQVHCYEPHTDALFESGKQRLGIIRSKIRNLANCSVVMRSEQDVTRDESKYRDQKADIMFVRNIMPTSNDDLDQSNTQERQALKGIHQKALRNRRNSIREGGQLNIGMSGAPGLVSATGKERYQSEAEDLFNSYDALADTAKESKFSAWTGAGDLPDFDRGIVMKNDGTSLGVKNTYYMTFIA